MTGLLAPLAGLKGVGPEREKLLAAADIHQLLDLLLITPVGYARTPELVPRPVAGLSAFTAVLVRARSGRMRGRSGGFLELVLRTETGDVRARWYGRGGSKLAWPSGTELLLTGRGAADEKDPFVIERCQVVQSEEELARALQTLHPRWPTIAGLAAGTLRSLIQQAVQADVPDPLAAYIGPEVLPLGEAFRKVHQPALEADADAGMERLLFDRFVALLVALGTGSLAAVAPEITVSEKVAERIDARLPFALTPGQRAVLEEILGDMKRTRPMRRVLQGDVGSGKTAVAVAAALATVAAGRSVIFLAPTQELAEQHHQLLARWLKGSRVKLALKTGGSATRPSELAEADIITATHAVLRAKLDAKRLGLVVIDEQQRFGVRNRLAAVKKGVAVHALSVSATPIPRTLMLTLLGDLPRSQLAGMPPGRAGLTTRMSSVEEALAAVCAAAARGERSFIVFPAITAAGVPALAREGRRWQRCELAALPVAMVHGAQPAEERQRGLESFRTGRALVLLATVLVEVGLDVPEATQMVILGAERHGLATLHQLRGRVGRGAKAGTCHIVPGASAKPEALQRMETLVRENDGFRLAEADLAQRGPGEVLGVRQAGHGGVLRVARTREDTLLELARSTAAKVLALDDPDARNYLMALQSAVSPEFRPQDAL